MYNIKEAVFLLLEEAQMDKDALRKIIDDCPNKTETCFETCVFGKNCKEILRQAEKISDNGRRIN